MNRRTCVTVAFVLFFLPMIASAQIVISEILYDADGSDTNKEYVELYNAGTSPITLSDWKINDGSNHTLNEPPKNGGIGSMTIGAGGYMLLVNNATEFLALYSDTPAPVIDTVLSLNNTAGTVLLVDATGTTIDSVSYSKDQGAADDGASLQKVGTSWVAAVPTPGTANSNTPLPVADEAEGDTGAASEPETSPSNVSDWYVAPPSPLLFADAGDDRTVIVGADTAFRGRAYDKKRELVTDLVRFSWNFGDGTTKEGANVLHHYKHPGTYAVVLIIAQDRTAMQERITVVAEPARLDFWTNEDGSISIHNNAGRDIDLSGWMVRSRSDSFIVPENTFALKGATLRITQETLGFPSTSADAQLLYPNGVIAYKAGETSIEAATVVQAPEPTFASEISSEAAELEESESEVVEELQEDPREETALSSTSSNVAAASLATGTALFGAWYWWLAALLFAGIVGVATVIVRRTQGKEWNIIEES